MPELPDVEVFKQYMDATALHRPVRRTEVGGGGDRRLEVSGRGAYLCTNHQMKEGG